MVNEVGVMTARCYNMRTFGQRSAYMNDTPTSPPSGERLWLTVTETREKMQRLFGRAYSTPALTQMARQSRVKADKTTGGAWLLYWPDLVRYLEEEGYGPYPVSESEQG